MKHGLLRTLIGALTIYSTVNAELPKDRLTPPSLSDEHILEKISCIRPMREGTFHIGADVKNQKLIVHDYGHGGAGYALLFGSVEQSLRDFEQALEDNPSFKDRPICVIGAGCIGLMTAIRLMEKGYEVRVVAKDFDHLASNYAAGTSWFISIKIIPEFRERARKVAADSWVQLNAII